MIWTSLRTYSFTRTNPSNEPSV